MRASMRFAARTTVQRLVETRIIHTSEICCHETRDIPSDDKEQELEKLKISQQSRSIAN